MKKAQVLSLLTILTLVLTMVTWLLHAYILDLSKPYTAVKHTAASSQTFYVDTVRVGVISRYPSNVIYKGYQPIMDYLTHSTDYYFELMISNSYDQTIEQLNNGLVDAAFLGSYIYVRSRQDYDITPILKPLNEDGTPLFQSSLIARDDSPVKSISDLAGKKIALPSRFSYSSNWLDETTLNDYGLIRDDFAEVTYFQHHHTVVYEIMRSNYDAGSVKERIAREFEGSGIRILARSAPVPGAPLVISARSHPDVVQNITDALLNINLSDPEVAGMVSRWDPEFAYGFTRAYPSDYDQLEPMIRTNQEPP